MYEQSLSLFNRRIVVDLNEVPIGIFKVNLFHAIHTDRWFFRCTRPVRVFHFIFVEVGNESIDILHAEAKVIVPVAFILFFDPFDQVQVPGPSNAEPGVFAIVEWLRNLFEAKDIFIKRGARLEVGYVHPYMVECHSNVGIVGLSP
jgi:hypothetical protein